MKDFLIVGGGIGGFAFAHLLHKKNSSFDLYDSSSENTCSTVAAGLINPIVLKRTNLAWEAKKSIDFALPFYSEIENKLTVKLIHKMPIRRVYADHEEANNWEVKSIQTGYESFLNTSPKNDEISKKFINTPFGFGEVNQSGYMNIPLYLSASRNFFSSINSYKEGKFLYENLCSANSKVYTYKNSQYKNVVFCEGVNINNNPLFKWVPVVANKGDVLLLHSLDESLNKLGNIYSKSMFLIPIGDNTYKAGSTYRRSFTELKAEKKDIDEITNRIAQFCSADFSIREVKSGLRPTVSDRRPIIGEHPKEKNIWVLNGLGSRGVIIAPLLSHFLLEKTIPKEINVERFYKHF